MKFAVNEGYWWYEKRLVNVGVFNNLDENIFVNRQPDFIINKMALLR
jgi:hypothetical protein